MKSGKSCNMGRILSSIRKHGGGTEYVDDKKASERSKI